MGVESWIAACWCTPCVIVENVKFALISPVSCCFLNMHIYINYYYYYYYFSLVQLTHECTVAGIVLSDQVRVLRMSASESVAYNAEERGCGIWGAGFASFSVWLEQGEQEKGGEWKSLHWICDKTRQKKGTEREKLESQRASGGWLIPAVLLWMLITSHPSIISVLVICVRASVAWIHADREMMMPLLACAASRCAVL